MFWNIITISIRNFSKYKRYYSLNFLGLTLGLACCALVVLYVNHETHFDDFHPEPENTYRFAGKYVYGPWIPSVALQYTHELINAPFSEIEKQVRIRRTPNRYSTVGNEKFSGDRTMMVDPGSQFFDIFGFELIAGKRGSVLSQPNSAVVTSSIAKKYFGTPDAIGRTFKYDTLLVQVTGVVADMPSNTHFDFDLLVTHPSYLKGDNGGALYYATLHDGADPNAVAAKIQSLNLGLNEYDSLSAIQAQAIPSIHLNSKMTFELEPGGNSQQLWLFSIIAFIILAISVNNYANMASALYSKRHGEIALRKILGSSRGQLSLQFLTESALLAIICVPVVILLVEWTLPYFSDFIGFTLENRFVSDPLHFALLFGIALTTGLLAGIYPSIVLPKTSILTLLRKTTLPGKLNLRQLLITSQFIMLIGLGAMAYFANRQVQFMHNFDTGFNANGVIKLAQAWSLQGSEKIKQFKNRLYENPSIEVVAQGYVPGDDDYTVNYKPEDSDITFSDALSLSTDHEYFTALDIEGLYGPYFTESADQHPRSSMLVNEAFVKNMGWDDPIGKRVNVRPDSPEPRWREVRGVFQDFNFYSLHKQVTPMILYAVNDRKYISQNILIKVNTTDLPTTRDFINQTWDEFVPNAPVRQEFMENDIEEAYATDQNTATLSIILTGIAIIMAMLGLIGLTAFIAENKTKEVGIRKVLGAPVLSIITGFVKEFLPSLLVATVLAGSAGYLIISSWLNNFAYQTELNILIFPTAGLMVMLVTVITVGLQSLKTARQNPVQSLKYE